MGQESGQDSGAGGDSQPSAQDVLAAFRQGWKSKLQKPLPKEAQRGTPSPPAVQAADIDFQEKAVPQNDVAPPPKKVPKATVPGVLEVSLDTSSDEGPPVQPPAAESIREELPDKADCARSDVSRSRERTRDRSEEARSRVCSRSASRSRARPQSKQRISLVARRSPSGQRREARSEMLSRSLEKSPRSACSRERSIAQQEASASEQDISEHRQEASKKRKRVKRRRKRGPDGEKEKKGTEERKKERRREQQRADTDAHSVSRGSSASALPRRKAQLSPSELPSEGEQKDSDVVRDAEDAESAKEPCNADSSAQEQDDGDDEEDQQRHKMAKKKKKTRRDQQAAEKGTHPRKVRKAKHIGNKDDSVHKSRSPDVAGAGKRRKAADVASQEAPPPEDPSVTRSRQAALKAFGLKKGAEGAEPASDPLAAMRAAALRAFGIKNKA